MKMRNYLFSILIRTCLLLLASVGSAASLPVFMDCNQGISNVSIAIPSIIECGSPVTATVTADVAANVLDSVVIDFVLPAGFSYAGNATGADSIGANPISLLAPISNGQVSFTFEIRGECGAGDSDGVDFNFNYIINPGSVDEQQITCTTISEDINTDDIAISIAPFGTPGRNTEDRILAVLGMTDTLTNTIVQEGDGVIDSVFYAVNAHPLMTLVDVIVCATGESLNLIESSGSVSYYGVGESAMSVDGTPGFVRNEGIDICEVWRVDSCPDGSIPVSSSQVSTSCDLNPAISTCQTDDISTFLDFDGLQPEISHNIDVSIPFDPICAATAPYDLGFILYNTGTAPAGRIQAFLTEFAGGTAFDLNSITFQIGSDGPINDFVDNGPNTDAFSFRNSEVLGCVTAEYPDVAGSLYNRADLEFSNINLPPGDTMFLRYTIYPRPCGCDYGCDDVPSRNGMDISDIDVWTLCDDPSQNSNISVNIAWPNFNVDIASFMESPSITCAGETSTLQTTVSDYDNAYLNNEGFNSIDDGERNLVYFNDEGACEDCYIEIQYEIPNGLDYVLGSVVWTDNDGTTWVPDVENYVDNNGGIDILTLRWTGTPPPGWDAYNEASLVQIDYTPDCGVEVPFNDQCAPILYDDQISKTVTWSQDPSCPDCDNVVECIESLPVTIKCPGTMVNCACDGFVQTLATGLRSNLYDPDSDNDGCYETTDTYDENLIRRDRYLKGDSIEVQMGGTLQLNTGNIAGLDYLYADIDMPVADYIPLGGVVTIIDATDGTQYTCDVLTQTIEPGNILRTDLSLPRLMANGCTSLPPTYEDGDSIHVSFFYTSNNSFTGEIDIQSFRTDMYASQTALGPRLSCTLPLDFRLSQVGLQSNFGTHTTGFNSFSGCATVTPTYGGYSRVGSANVDFFPGEYIGFVERIDQFRISIPPGMVFDDMLFFLRRKNSAGSFATFGSTIAERANSAVGNPFGFSSSGFAVDATNPGVTIVGDEVIFDIEAFMMAQFGTPELPCSDEGYFWEFRPNFLPTCNLEPGNIGTFFMEADHRTNQDIFCSTGYVNELERSTFVYGGGAEIVIEAVNVQVEVNSFPTCAVFRVSNVGSDIANNVWMSLESQSNDIIIQSVNRLSGSSSTPVNGDALNLYELGDVRPGASSSVLFEVCAVVNSCEADILDIFAGYDCVGYPTIRQEATCQSTDEIEFVPVEGSLSMSAKFPDMPINVGLCDTIEHIIDLNAAGPGFLSDVFVDAILPPNTEFVPGSWEIAYPTTATPTTLAPDSEYAPAPDPFLVTGNRYRFLVNEADSILLNDGLIGSAGSAFNLNVVNIRYKVVTGCGYSSGSRIRYRSNANSGCGNQLSPVRRDFTERMNIFGAPDPFISDIGLNADTLNACSNDFTSIDISYQINGDMTTNDEDSIRVILPPGIAFIPGSYRSGNSPIQDPPLMINENGLDVLQWGIAGLIPGESITFSFDIEGVDIGQECDDYELLVQTFKSGSAFCPSLGDMGGLCTVRTISNEASAEIFIIKPEISVTDASATNGMLMGDEEMIDFSFTITNDGTVSSDATTDITVDLYGDLNGDCRLTPGEDTLLTSLVFGATLTPGESIVVNQTANIPVGFSCNLMAIIDNSKNCSCETTTSSCIRADIDLKLDDDVEVCSEETIDIGPTAIAAYDYTWSGLSGADETVLSSLTGSPTQFLYDNNLGSDITWQYGIRVDRAQGCFTFDTVAVTVFAETDGAIQTQICNPVPGCGDPVAGFSLSGPIDGTDYQWSIAEGDMTVGFVGNSDNMSAAEVDGLISETTVFFLDYLDANGCPATFAQTVDLTTCACTMLGDTVWFDLNVNGIQDIGEPGIPGVTVFLYEANDLTTPIQSTTTDADGYYIFQPLPSGNYVVQFDESTHTSPFHLLEPTLQDVGADDTDSDADPLTGFTGPYFIPNGISNLTVDAGFYPAFDLALTKQINTNLSPGPYFAGDNINYTITVINQGGFYGATDIRIGDYFTPGELSYIGGSAGIVSSANAISTTIIENGGGVFTIDTLAPLDMVSINVEFTIDASFTGTDIVNFAEISDFSNSVNIPDSDSTPDSIDGNDVGGVPLSTSDNHVDDDTLDSDGDGIIDEDDHDPAIFEISTVDLALNKRIDPNITLPAEVGDVVKYDIIVINQGDVPVQDVTVQDYVPTGYTFNQADPLNVAQGWNAAVQSTIPGILLPGDRDTVSIYLTVELSFNDADYINASEIISALDTTTGRDVAPFDIDSDPNSNTANEQATAPNTIADNNVISTGDAQPGSQDDHDVETIPVAYPILDVQKDHVSTVANTSGPNCFDITYQIQVINSGLAEGIYDLVDNPNFDDDVVSNPGVEINHTVPGRTSPLALLFSSNIELADNQTIGAGVTHRYLVTFDVCLNLEDASSPGDEVYDPCGSSSVGGEPAAGEGAFNSTALQNTDFDGLFDSQDTVCVDLPYLTINKTISSVMEETDGSFTTIYNIVVENIGGDSIPYDLYDLPQYDDDVMIASASFTSSVGFGGVLPSTVPTTGWFLADDVVIQAMDSHTYTVSVTSSIDLTAETGDGTYDPCGSGSGGASEAGDGLFNLAYLDLTDDQMADLQDTACADLPVLTMTKELSTVTGPNADGSYDIVYTLSVTNIGGIADDYDLYDLPGFENDIEILSASYTSTQPTNPSGTLGISVPTDGWLIADGDMIPAMTTYIYTLTVNVEMDLSDGTFGDDTYLACGAGGGTGSAAGEGLHNQASLDVNEDGISEVIDTACADLPFVEVSKEVIEIVETSFNCYDVSYTIEVTNRGGASTEYDLSDNPAFDDDFIISNFNYTSDVAGNMSGNPGPISGSYLIASDQSIGANTTHTYTIVVSTCLDLNDNLGDNMYSASCGNATGGMDPSPMEGLYNEASVDLNGDGIADVTDDACADVPYLVITKSLENRTLIGANNYEVVYLITVSNLGGADGAYNLYDAPQPDDDIIFNDANYTSNTSNTGPLTVSPVPAVPGWLLAADEPIIPGGVHTYELIVDVNLDLSIPDGIGDDTYTECGASGIAGGASGEGLFNEAFLDVNDDMIPDDSADVCLDLADLIMDKTLVSISPQNPDGSFDVQYEIIVTNVAGAIGTYDLVDLPGYEDDITINMVSYTSDVPGNGGGGLASTPPPGGWVLGSTISIGGQVVHTYTLDVNVTLDLADGLGDDIYTSCGSVSGGSDGPNMGLYNQAQLDENGDGTPEEINDACGDLPSLSMTKEIFDVTQTTANCYDISYRIVVTNDGGATGQYDLVDTPGFDDDFEITGVSYTSTASGIVINSLDPTNTSFTLADDQSIVAGRDDTYILTVSVCLDLEDGIAGDDIYNAACGVGTGGTPTSDQGLFNQAAIDTNNDGVSDDSDSDCADVPFLVIRKSVQNSTELPDGSFDVVYLIEVENIGGATGTYDLADEPQFDDDIVILGSSFTSTTANSNANLGASVPLGGWTLANNQDILAMTTDSYSLTVNMQLNLTDGLGDDIYTPCGSGPGGSSSAGDGAFNEARLDVDNDGNADSEADACQDLPFLIMEKSIASISTQNADGTYDITYTIIVENIGGVADDYNLNDLPSFEDDITIISASFASNIPTSDNALSAIPPAGGWVLSSGEVIMAGTQHIYTLVVNVDIDLLDGVNGNDVYAACGSGSGANPETGQGLFNTAILDASEDGMPEVIDTACGDLPFLVLDKVHASTVMTSLNCYDVTYTLTVENIGGATGTYDLVDDPMFDSDFEVNSAVFSTDAAGAFGTDISLEESSTQYLLTPDAGQEIVAGKTDTYTVVVSVCLDLENASSPGNEVYDASCGTANGGEDSSTGEGLHNEAFLDTNNDGVTDQQAEACDDVPYLILDKSLASLIEIAPYTYETVYTIVVENIGGDTGTYDLIDLPQYDDDIIVDSIYFLSTVGSGGALSLPIPTDGWVLADDQTIQPSSSHTFTLTSVIRYDFSDAIGDNTYTECGSSSGLANPQAGEGLFNEAFLDINNDGESDIIDSDCGDIEAFDLALRKELITAGPYNYGDELIYEITVINQGTEDANQIRLLDHVPCGLSFNAFSSINFTNGWNVAFGDAVTTTLAQFAPLVSGDSITVQLALVLEVCTTSPDRINIAEIFSALDEDFQPGDDVDSTPDIDPDNDTGGTPRTDEDDHTMDDAMDFNMDGIIDEDDHDPAQIEIFDLALTKELITAGPYNYGDTLDFNISVCNQGNIGATDVTVQDYLPNGYLFDVAYNPAWMNVSGGAVAIVTDTIGAGTCYDIPLRLVLIRTIGGERDWINYAEIVDAFNESGENRNGFDIDSNPGSNGPDELTVEPGDAADNDIDSIDKGGEEDDHDPAGIEIVDLALTKMLVSQGTIFPGDTVQYVIEVFNQGSVIATDVLIYDHVPNGLTFINSSIVNNGWSVVNPGLISYVISQNFQPGNSLQITINMIANDGDLGMDDYVNVAEIGEINDDSGNDISDEEIDSNPDDISENDGGGEVDSNSDDEIDGDGTGSPGDTNGPTDEDDSDPASICIVDYACPEDMNVPSCNDQSTINQEFDAWLELFVGQNCGVASSFVEDYTAPDACGGSIDVTFQVFEIQGNTQILLQECTSSFSVDFDDIAPVCPTDWDLTVDYDGCIVAPYSTVPQLENETGANVIDNCDDSSDLELTSFDAIIHQECSGSGSFFSSREVIRTYQFTDECGNVNELCPQLITYNFDQCNQVTDPGAIAIGGSTVVRIPSGCDAPTISETSPASSDCNDLIEHLWLSTTVERSPGVPFVPNPLNTGAQGSGSVWEIIDGANSTDYTPETVDVNTYFVRCTRSFSCCEYIETNLVAFIIDDNDPNLECPIITVDQDVNNNCDELIVLTNPFDNLTSGQDTSFVTDRTIEADNIIDGGAYLILDAKEGTTLKPGFEVNLLGQLEVYIQGCNED